MPAAKSISSDSQHHPTCPERSHPTCSADPIPSAPGTSQPCLVTPSPHRPLSRSQSAVPLIFWADVSHIQPRLFPSSPPEALSRSPFSPPPLEFWTVLQFLAPVFDTCLEFWAVFPSHRLKKCLRTQATKPLTWGFPIPSTTALAIMASKPPRRFWTPHRSPIRRPPQPASPLRRSPLRCLPLPTSMPTAARTIHTKRDFASISNRRRNLAVHAIRSPATARQTSAALPLSRRYPCKVRSLFLQDPGKGFARRRRQTASKPTHIPDAPTRR
mgnify:FL=1